MISANHEDDFSFQDKMPDCSCGRANDKGEKNKVVYYCDDEDCPNN